MRVARRLPAASFRTLRERFSSHRCSRRPWVRQGSPFLRSRLERSVGRPLETATYFLTSSYLCAILAYVIARIVHRFNLQMKDAREIGSYELIERIGAGGMGEVWRARHRLLARPAAIKLIRSSMLGESQRGREDARAALRARSARDRRARLHPHDRGLRLRCDRRRRLLLRDGAARRASVSSGWCRNSDRWTRRGRCTCCSRSVTRSARPTLVVWSTATSSPQTSWSAGSVLTMTS